MRISFLTAAGIALFSSFSFGQNLAGFGYRVPANSITAAPGQALMVSVRGVRAVISNMDFGSVTASGISAEYVQGAEVTKLTIQTIQQTKCAPAAASTCQPVTSMLVQIPQRLKNGSLLRIKEQSAVVSEITLRRVEDAIHLLSNCDELRGLPFDTIPAPDGRCTTLMAAGRGLSYENPARGGETLFVWAFGLGAVDRPYPMDRPHEPEVFPRPVQPITLNFTFEGNAPLAERRIANVAPVYAGLIGQDGLYQINFVVPAVPANLPKCAGPGDFNLTVTVVGTDSADAARLCVE